MKKFTIAPLTGSSKVIHMRKEKHQHEFTPRYFSKRKNSAGFTLLYSVLVTSLLLAIGIAIFNISIKEVILSGSARDSQFAFYAADAGIECALYWDIKHSSFATSTTSTIDCGEKSFPGMGGSGYNVPSVFTMTFLPETYCARVSVIKSESPRRTIVESRGFNTCDVNNPRRVERALRATY